MCAQSTGDVNEKLFEMKSGTTECLEDRRSSSFPLIGDHSPPSTGSLSGCAVNGASYRRSVTHPHNDATARATVARISSLATVMAGSNLIDLSNIPKGIIRSHDTDARQHHLRLPEVATYGANSFSERWPNRTRDT